MDFRLPNGSEGARFLVIEVPSKWKSRLLEVLE